MLPFRQPSGLLSRHLRGPATATATSPASRRSALPASSAAAQSSGAPSALVSANAARALSSSSTRASVFSLSHSPCSSPIAVRTEQNKRGFKMSPTAHEPTLTLDNMNPAVKRMEYAVRGALVIRATEIEKEIAKVGTPSLIHVICDM